MVRAFFPAMTADATILGEDIALIIRKENDLLEETLSLAEQDYGEAYRYLMKAYEEQPDRCGPQTLYFLACLAGGSHRPEAALAWLQKAILDKGWWYRPEVLADDDLAALQDNAAFLAAKALSDARYAEAASSAKAVFSWQGKTADRLFLAVHGNTQNGQIAREDWAPLLAGHPSWQLETVQSAEPDSYGTYRWRYDRTAFLPVAQAMQHMQDAGYARVVCGGFSAGCDMLLRAVLWSPARCDTLLLQSPWLPLLQDSAADVVCALQHKGIDLRISCGAEDEDCLPMARQLHEAARGAGLRASLTIQMGCRHQFPEKPLSLDNL